MDDNAINKDLVNQMIVYNANLLKNKINNVDGLINNSYVLIAHADIWGLIKMIV